MLNEKLKEEFRKKIEKAETLEEVEKIKKDYEALASAVEETRSEDTKETEEAKKDDNKEEKQEEKQEEKEVKKDDNKEEKQEEKKEEKVDERSLVRDSEKIEKRNLSELKEVNIKEEKMEKRFTTADAEYRNAWAKAMMGVKLNEVEKRAIGDALGTTGVEFVKAAEGTQGINNFGLLIPESLRKDLLTRIEQQSPIYRDITKLNINGNIDLPYLFASDDAEWYGETSETKNEGQEYKNLKLTGFELAKDIEVTWKAEAMTVEGFMNFLTEELSWKMNTALINAVIYGDGAGKPTGITNGLTAVENTSVIEAIKGALAKLTNDARVGAKVYVSSAVADEITFYKDENGNYPYLAAGLGNANGVQIETDPFLKDNDIVAGNMKNYILNFNQLLRVDRAEEIKPRRVIYGAYLVADGNKKPDSFAYAKVSATV